MNQRFKRCLERKQIYRDPNAKDFVRRELDAARQDLSEAGASFQENKYKWATIQAYYSMFHAFRALLFSEGHRERSHYCLSVAIEALFVEPGRMEESLLIRFANVKALREKADYDLEFSPAGAEKSLQAAEDLARKRKGLVS